MNTECNRCFYEFADKLNLKNLNKNMVLANLAKYLLYMGKPAYNNNKFKISATSWNDEFSLPMDHVLFQAFKIILSALLKNMKL